MDYSLIGVGLWSAALSAQDMKSRTLPNWLTVGGAVAVLCVNGWLNGSSSVVDGIAAGVVAGAFLLIPFLLRGAGGGDVKMLFAAGTMVGWSKVLYLLWYTSLAGLVVAVVMLVFKQVESARLKHYVRCLVDWRYDRQAGAAALPPKESAQTRIPFSIAISIGLILAMVVKP